MRHAITTAALALTVAGCAVSTQQEVQMGAEYAQQINSQLPIVRDPEVNRYINILGDQIASRADDRGLEWHFYVVDSREVNAFAVPGGFIYVNRGLIERTQNLSQLAGVLGHEIGHVTRRHSIEQMQQAQKANIGVTLACVLTRICESQVAQTGINVAGTALFSKFSRDDEREADTEGIRNVIRAGISPQGIPQMFQILLNERQRNPAAVEAWFATHPTEEERIRDTQSQIASLGAAAVQGLSMDTQAYQAFKRRVQSLPAPRSR